MLATLTVAEASARDVHEGRQLKDAIYRAFWQERRDISSPKVLWEICSEIRVQVPSDPEAHKATQKLWQSEWEGGPYGRRLPVLHSRDGALSLGLATSAQLSEFVWTGVDQRNEDDSC
ncbi:MAG: hypothetical protein ACI9KE_003011 [Polyangiales bacterium]|jgi:hypothetical protein